MFEPQDVLQNGLRSAQDGSKRLLKRNFFALTNRLKFGFVLGPILVDFWPPKPPPRARDVSALRGLEVELFLACYHVCVYVSFGRLKVCVCVAPGPPQERPRGPKTLPRAPKEAPRGRQECSRRLQEGLKRPKSRSRGQIIL